MSNIKSNIKSILPLYINGEFVDTGNYFDNINPVNGTLNNQVVLAGKNEVDRAVVAAKQALSGSWGKLSVNQRVALLHQVADGIIKREKDFIEAEIADTGKSMPQVKSIDIPRGSANFRFFSDLVKYQGGETFLTETPDGQKALNYSVNKPLGVVAIISPWNLPLLLMTWKVAPAMALGNAVIVKPSEETPSTATLLAEVMNEVGIPKGAFNLLHGFGPDSAGQFLTQHPEIDAITFTGESSTGTHIMKAAAQGVKPVSFELGGKNAAVVFADADFEKAVAGVARSTFTNCGQVCLCTERVYVERSIFEKFVVALKEKAEAIVVGDPYDESVVMGPLVSHKHREKVLSYFELAKKEGAHVVTGGGVPQFNNDCDQGSFVEPTVFTGLSDEARINREEIFGPVCHVSPFDTEEEVLKRVNASDYGLACAIWTENLAKAHRLAPKVDTGITWVNTWFLRDLRTPFGGVKLSGIGREGGMHSLAFYSEPQNICIKLDD